MYEPLHEDRAAILQQMAKLQMLSDDVNVTAWFYELISRWVQIVLSRRKTNRWVKNWAADFAGKVLFLQQTIDVFTMMTAGPCRTGSVGCSAITNYTWSKYYCQLLQMDSIPFVFPSCKPHGYSRSIAFPECNTSKTPDKLQSIKVYTLICELIMVWKISTLH